MDIYSTYFMLAAVREIPLEHTFFKRRYFPTDAAMDIFGTARVLADYKEDSQKRAPFVLPRIGSIPGTRDGFSTAELEPANIAVAMPLTLDQLQKRGFGESLLSQATPADRAQHFLISDLAELSARISRTEELLAVKTMIDNGTVMRHRTDSADIYEDVGAYFYDGNNNPALFTPSSAWEHSTYDSTKGWTPGNWYNDICAMIRQLTQSGRPAREIVVAQDVGDFLMTDGWVLDMLDNRRAEMGRIAPTELTEYVYEIGAFNFKGRVMPILVSDGTYDEGGVDTAYVPAGTVIVTAPNCGRGLYGAVTQMETDGNFHTYAGTRVPQHIFTIRPPVKETQLTARPLFVPNRPNPWCVATDVLI